MKKEKKYAALKSYFLSLYYKVKNWRRPNLKSLKSAGKKYFLLWVVYQTVKGILTTSLIWIPLIYGLFFKK